MGCGVGVEGGLPCWSRPTGIRWRMPNGKIENVAKTGSSIRRELELLLEASIIDFCARDSASLPWNCLLTLGFLLRAILLPPRVHVEPYSNSNLASQLRFGK